MRTRTYMAQRSMNQGRAPRRYQAPGRVNLIGEHTDYNDGFVLPAAIAYRTRVSATPRDDRRVSVASGGFHGRPEFDLDRLERGVRHLWSDHIRGMLVELQQDGAALCGADLEIETDLPIGAGLSSSASVSVAVGYALLDVTGLPVDRVALARTAQRAENAHAGANTGIMDQFVCANARSGTAMLLDTRSLACEYVPLPRDAEVIVCDTMTRHAHATGAYNDRRAECAEGLTALRARYPQIASLRDVTAAQLEAARETMSGTIFRRCRHVVTENERTERAARALRDGDLADVGVLMNESHSSLRDDYEVSVPELDTMVALARRFDGGIYGARMTGGGFGGSTVMLVSRASADAFSAFVTAAYRGATGLEAAVYRGVGATGVERVP